MTDQHQEAVAAWEALQAKLDAIPEIEAAGGFGGAVLGGKQVTTFQVTGYAYALHRYCREPDIDWNSFRLTREACEEYVQEWGDDGGGQIYELTIVAKAEKEWVDPWAKLAGQLALFGD